MILVFVRPRSRTETHVFGAYHADDVCKSRGPSIVERYAWRIYVYICNYRSCVHACLLSSYRRRDIRVDALLREIIPRNRITFIGTVSTRCLDVPPDKSWWFNLSSVTAECKSLESLLRWTLSFTSRSNTIFVWTLWNWIIHCNSYCSL